MANKGTDTDTQESPKGLGAHFDHLLTNGTKEDWGAYPVPVQASLVDAWSRKAHGEAVDRAVLGAASIVAGALFLGALIVAANLPDEMDVNLDMQPAAELEIETEVRGKYGGAVELQLQQN